MDKPRRKPNLTEIAAASLLTVKRGDEWLIPEPLRSTGTAKQIVAYCEKHHKHMYTFGGDTSPQNMAMLAPLEHKRETVRLQPWLNKIRRMKKRQEQEDADDDEKHAQFRRKVLAPRSKRPLRLTKKGNRPMPFGRSDPKMKRLNGTVVDRDTRRFKPGGAKHLKPDPEGT